MTTITINIPTEFDFRRSGVVFRCNPSALPSTIIEQLVLHGIVQKVGDSAAGKNEADAKTAMQSTWDTLASGDWGKTRAGDSDPLAVYRQGVIRDMLKTTGGDAWRAYKAHKDAKDRVAHLDAILAKQDDATRDAIESAARDARTKHEAEIEARKAQAAKLAGGLSLTI